jgi:outer membrane protein TolC
MRMDRARRWLLLATLMLGIGACTTGKDLPPPALADLGLADRYASVASPDENAATAEAVAAPLNLERWWQSFQDPVLDALIEHARSDNLDVVIAAQTKRNGRESMAALRNRKAADIARNYIALRARQAMLENTRDFLDQRQATIRLASFRLQAGLVPALDVARAVAGRDAVAARLADLNTRNRQDVAAIAVLTGQPPQALGDLLDGQSHIPLGPASVALGRPSDLRLPPADKRPRRALAIVTYKRALLGAIAQVEVQSAAFEGAKHRERALERAVAAAETAALLARKAYGEGLADYSALEQVEDGLLSMRNALRLAQAQRAVALAGLYLALGGEAAADSGSDMPGG